MSRLLLAIAASLLATPVLAADLAPAPVEPAAPVVASYSWTGFYVGAQAGYAWGKNWTGDYFKQSHRVEGQRDLDPDGFFGGVHAGYNYQFPIGVVVGAEADVNLAAIGSGRGPLHAPAGDPPLPPGNTSRSKMNWNGSVRARLGYAIDRFLPYVTGGYAVGHYDVTAKYLNVPTSIHLSDTLSGWTIGAGLEYAITDKITTRVEYRYTEYEKQSGPIPGFPLFENSADRLKTNDVRAGISYKF